MPVKQNSPAENQASRGGAQKGHRGVGRQAFSPDEADETRIVEVADESCPGCACSLNRLSSNERSVYELERERVRRIYYSIERKLCPQCRRIESGKVAGVFARCSLSNELIVEVAGQHYVLGRTLGQLADRFSINYSTLSEALKRIGKMPEPGLEKLKKDYRQKNELRLAKPGRSEKTGNLDEYLANTQKARRKSTRQISQSLKQIKSEQRPGSC